MSNIASLLDLACNRSGLNQSAVASRLHRSRQTVTNWKSGQRIPEDQEVIALAKLAGEDPDTWMAIAQAARSEGIARTHWQRIARRLTSTTALLAVALLPVLSGPVQADLSHACDGQLRHYAKSGRVRRWVAQVRRWIGMQVALLLAPSSIEARS